MPVDRLLGMGLALLLTGLLYLVMRGSRIGRAIVAVRMDSEAAALMGIRVKRIYAITFGIGALMAGATGAIFAMVYPITTNLTGTFLGKAFVVCVIGGLGSVQGALAGGIVLGIVESFAGQFFGPQHALTVGFRADAGAAGGEADRPHRHQGLRVMARRCNTSCSPSWVLALASTPLWAGNYVVRLAVIIAMYTALTLSWNFIGGFTGYPSFSTAAFFGLGCYAGALSQRAGVPMVLAWASPPSSSPLSRPRSAPSFCGCAGTISRSARSASSR